MCSLKSWLTCFLCTVHVQITVNCCSCLHAFITSKHLHVYAHTCTHYLQKFTFAHILYLFFLCLLFCLLLTASARC